MPNAFSAPPPPPVANVTIVSVEGNDCSNAPFRETLKIFQRQLVLVDPRVPVNPGAVGIRTMKAYVRERWCVDSGANRDICRDISYAEGKAIPKPLLVGEAGKGHGFYSEAEGPIKVLASGKPLPLFQRVVFAKKIAENIMSVSEAVDRGYTVIFSKEGVQLFKKEEVKISGAPILKGALLFQFS